MWLFCFQIFIPIGVQILSRNKAISYLNSCNSAISFPRNGMINQKVCKNNSNELNTRIHKMAADGEYKKRHLERMIFLKEGLSQ